jgi:hypothetical protein
LAIFIRYPSITKSCASLNGEGSSVLSFPIRSCVSLKECTGDVVYFKVFGRPMVVLDTLMAARDLLEKRSGNYSCRPRFVLLVEM